MKKQFTLVALSAFSFLVLIAIVFSSCEKQEQNFGQTTFYKPCEDVFCLNGGTCLDGNCICAVGFEGEECGTRSVDKFIGTYEAFDDCFQNAQVSYTASIGSDFTPFNELTLNGFGTLCTNSLTALIINEKSNFSIPFQRSCQNYWVSGEANMDGTVLNVNLNFRDSVTHTTTNCSILMNKQ